ncbi:MAG: metallophosphoesterase [Roseiflexaceae bacterium]
MVLYDSNGMIWTISDLHLSFANPKPMDIFGNRWRNHPERIAAAWRRLVAVDDVVLIAGDISWAMHLNDALRDLTWIDELPGRKFCIKGNHDYWWDRAAPIRARMPASITLVEANAYDLGEVIVCGSRGWSAPGMPGFDPAVDQRIYARELLRMQRALDDASAIAHGRPIVAMIHFPPFIDRRATDFVSQFRTAGVQTCLYGHLHRPDDWGNAVQGMVDGITYQLTACDYLEFTPVAVRGLQLTHK